MSHQLALLALRVSSRGFSLTNCILWGAAATAGALLGLIVFVVLAGAAPALSSVGLERFFTDESWHPTSDQFNLAPLILGTFLVAAGALGLACPIGLAAAVFVTFYAPPWMAIVYRRLMELFAGVPSVIFGLWGLVVLVPLIARLSPPGASLLAAILVLTLMVLPTVMLIAATSLGSVPVEHLHGARALGFSRVSTIVKVIIPAARKGLAAAAVLGAGRAIGETMAVMMVAGNVVRVPDSIFDSVRTLSANIALEIAYAVDLHRSALFVSALVMIAFVLVLVWVLELLTYRAGSHANAD
jgi:phosphate transport system permease protein